MGNQPKDDQLIGYELWDILDTRESRPYPRNLNQRLRKPVNTFESAIVQNVRAKCTKSFHRTDFGTQTVEKSSQISNEISMLADFERYNHYCRFEY